MGGGLTQSMLGSRGLGPLGGLAFRRHFFSFPTIGGKPSLQTYQLTRKLNFAPSLMFQIVSQVDRYHEFVPFVEESFVNKRDAAGLPLEAGYRVGWNQFDETFTCAVRCERDQRLVAESVTALLFEVLYTEWKFREIQNPYVAKLSKPSASCEVELNLRYQFKNPLYNTVSLMFSEQVAQMLVRAFEQRARDLLRAASL